jgi:hypothetical protein
VTGSAHTAPTGIELARDYYADVVGPLLLRRWPSLPHAAGRLGSGSDVLGLDDATSRDHDFGLRLTLLADAGMVTDVDAHLAGTLPETYAGLPTRFATTWHPESRHQVDVSSPDDFARSRLGTDVPTPDDATGWLALTGQAVLEVTAGPLFVDTDGEITRIRDQLAWYPDDVWRYVLAADWSRIGQELPFLGRMAQRGDDLGSRVLAARLVRDVMHLGFLLERRWPPYSKWLGTLFAELPSARTALPSLGTALAAESWQEREAALSNALTVMLELQRDLGLPADTTAVEPFYERPFRGVRPIDQLLFDSIRDENVRRLGPGIGSLEQWIDSTVVLTGKDRARLGRL